VFQLRGMEAGGSEMDGGFCAAAGAANSGTSTQLPSTQAIGLNPLIPLPTTSNQPGEVSARFFPIQGYQIIGIFRLV
jgi:hypothetical protein